MNFVRLSSPEDPMFLPAMTLYQQSFPLHEQRTPASQMEALSQADYHFTLIYDADAFVGILLYWEAAPFLYVEHFCIDPQLRNQAYGRRSLARLAEEGKPVILEIDPLTTEIAVRRKGFYERCGFQANDFSHVHPPYRKGFQGHELVVMTCPNPLSPEEYDAFRRYLRDQVMAGCPAL